MAQIAKVAANYYVILKDQSGAQVAYFDHFIGLDIEKKANDVGSYSLVFADNGDSRFDLFQLDGQVEIYRGGPPGSIFNGYSLEFEGLHRKLVRKTDSSGLRTFISAGPSYEDMLARTNILYKSGTGYDSALGIGADHRAVPEQVMKEYVRDNCTSVATDWTVVGRLSNGQLSNFTVAALYARDPISDLEWQGDRGFENLLTTLQEIAAYSGIDFRVVGDGPAAFRFQTYLGKDRTARSLNQSTGNNSAGNKPMIFSVENGNVADAEYTLDYTQEANVVAVLGKGDRTLRHVEVCIDYAAMTASPWNRREIARPGNTQDADDETYQLIYLGNEILQENKAKEQFIFTPLQVETSMYGVHYFLADKVTARYGNIDVHKRIDSIRINLSANQPEAITINFSDLPGFY